MNDIITINNDTPLADLATRINSEHAAAIRHAETAIEHARRAGEMLLQVKASMKHGEFLPWVGNSLNVSARQAQRYMAAAMGKPITPRRIKCDAVSYFTPKEGESVVIELREKGWLDQIYIFPHTDPRYAHYVHLNGPDDAVSGAHATYTKRAIRLDFIGRMVERDIPNWRAARIECAPHPGRGRNFIGEDWLTFAE